MHLMILIYHLSTPTFTPPTWRDLGVWIALNIGLSLVPLFISCIILAWMTDWPAQGRHYLNLLKEGQLYFLSATLAATLISRLFTIQQHIQQNPSIVKDVSTVYDDILSFITVAIFLLLISALFFGLTVKSSLKPSPEDAHTELRIIQYRVNLAEKRFSGNMPQKQKNTFLQQIKEIKDNKLEEDKLRLDNAKALAENLEKQLNGQPPQGPHNGM